MRADRRPVRELRGRRDEQRRHAGSAERRNCICPVGVFVRGGSGTLLRATGDRALRDLGYPDWEVAGVGDGEVERTARARTKRECRIGQKIAVAVGGTGLNLHGHARGLAFSCLAEPLLDGAEGPERVGETETAGNNSDGHENADEKFLGHFPSSRKGLMAAQVVSGRMLGPGKPRMGSSEGTRSCALRHKLTERGIPIRACAYLLIKTAGRSRLSD